MLILITPDHISEHHYATLKQALEWVDKLHIKLQYSTSNIENEITNIIENIVPDRESPLRKKICLHLNEYFLHHLQVLPSLQLTNIHLPEKLYEHHQKHIPENVYHHYNVSTSVHHLDIDEHYNKFSYLIYGPVFPSISKTNYLPSKNLEELKKDLTHIHLTVDIPIIAVGGITIDNFQALREAGFSGIALRGHIWTSSNTIETLRQFVETWRK